MTTAQFNLENVTKEIQNWVLNYLDVPNDHYSGMKPCPFAAEAWAKDKSKVVLGGEAELIDIVNSWDDEHEVVLFVVREHQSGGLEDWCNHINKELLEDKRDLVLMPFIAGDEDPDDPDLEPDHWGKLLDEAYSLVFVQRLTHVNRVSEVLERTGYYDKLGPEFLQYVKERRGS